MKQILGMAKSYLDLRGSKPRNLELDFMHLAFAISKAKAEGHAACGILLVLREEIKVRAEGWREKYGISQNEIKVVLAQTTPDEERILKIEKSKNAQSNREGASSEGAFAKSSERIGEDHLRSEVKKLFPTVVEGHSELPYLKNVKWDFCGIVTHEKEGTS